jgi:transcriptional antiterminator NusG
MLFAYRVTSGQEGIVADLLHEKIRKNKIPVQAILASHRLRGYLIVEAENEAEAKKLINNMPHIKGTLNRSMSIADVADLLESKPVEVKIEKGDMIEVTSGPFKGEKAKIVRIDEEKDDITVELVEVAVPIPVTIKRDAIRVLPKP